MKLKQKLVASGLHFLISLAIFSAFIVVLLYAWYPEPYFTASGGFQGLRIVILVDLVLGPLLTLVVFNLDKPRSELTRDLGIIALLQISALAWGIHAVSGQRPLAIVFWENSFYTVPQAELKKHYSSHPLYHELVEHPRQLIYGEKPVEREGIEQMVERARTLDLPPHQHLEYYRDFSDFFAVARRFNTDIDEIIALNEDMKKQLENQLEKSGGRKEDYIYLALMSRYRNIILMFDQQGQNIGYLQAPYL